MAELENIIIKWFVRARTHTNTQRQTHTHYSAKRRPSTSFVLSELGISTFMGKINQKRHSVIYSVYKLVKTHSNTITKCKQFAMYVKHLKEQGFDHI